MIDATNFRKRYLLKVKTPSNSRGTMLGSTGLIALVGMDMANHLVSKAERSTKDVFVCKLRRGFEFRFYVY